MCWDVFAHLQTYSMCSVVNDFIVVWITLTGSLFNLKLVTVRCRVQNSLQSQLNGKTFEYGERGEYALHQTSGTDCGLMTVQLNSTSDS
jgi:hypothetical protein